MEKLLVKIEKLQAHTTRIRSKNQKELAEKQQRRIARYLDKVELGEEKFLSKIEECISFWEEIVYNA